MTDKSFESGHVVILAPMVWSIRNVVTSGLIGQLIHSGVEVSLLTFKPIDRVHSGISSSVRVETLLVPRKKKTIRGRSLLNDVLTSSFAQEKRIDSYKIFQNWLHRSDNLILRLRRKVVNTLARLFRNNQIRSVLEAVALVAYQAEYDFEPVKEHIARLRPTILYSTICVSSIEYPYVLCSQQIGIPTVTSVLSFDNLTSRGAIPRFEKYLVWNDKMREQLLTFYPKVRPECVTITGTAQFDFHVSPKFRLSRAETLASLGLPSGARYILYGANHCQFTPNEPRLIEHLSDHIRGEESLSDLWIIVRLHPLDRYARWDELTKSRPNIIVQRPWISATDSDGWVEMGASDQAVFVSTIRHCEMCLNVASTLALDAAILDKPVIGVSFAGGFDQREDNAYRSFFNTDHYKPLVESGAIDLADSWETLIAKIKENLLNPEKSSSARARMVAKECGVVDGRAGERVVQCLSDILASTNETGVF